MKKRDLSRGTIKLEVRYLEDQIEQWEEDKQNHQSEEALAYSNGMIFALRWIMENAQDGTFKVEFPTDLRGKLRKKKEQL